MNRKILVIIVVGIVTFIAGFIFVQSKAQTPASQSATGGLMQKDEEAMEKDDPSAGAGQDTMVDGSRYVEYTKASFNSAAGNRRVLYFYANWCPTCRPADANFKENASKIPEDVTVIRVNYNDTDTDQEEKDLARKYGITYQHTFVQIDEQGEQVAKWNGGQLDELLTQIR